MSGTAFTVGLQQTAVDYFCGRVVYILSISRLVDDIFLEIFSGGSFTQ